MFGPDKDTFALPFEGMLEVVCAVLGVERSGFGEEVVYRECQSLQWQR